MSSQSVLIVDDDDLARLALAEVLQRCGIGVVCVSTPDDARKARECRVIVAELRLTGQTADEGRALLAELRDRRGGTDVVIFSSFLGSEPADELVCGVAASLPKSTPLRVVADTIRTLVERPQ